MKLFLFLFTVFSVIALSEGAKKKKKTKAKKQGELTAEDLLKMYPEAFTGAENPPSYDQYDYSAYANQQYQQQPIPQEQAAPVQPAYIDLPPMMARITLKKVIYEGRTSMQSIKVVEAPFFGRILIIDGDLMLTERDEFHYHEMMAHVPLAYLPDAKRVLIIGGGDGGLALQVLQHPRITNVTLVEIDEGVIEVCKRYIPSLARVYKSKRMTTVIGDGAKFVRDMCDNDVPKYDLVIVDSTDAGPAFPLATQEFYENVKSCALKRERGIYVFNMQSASWGAANLGLRAKNVSKIFDNAYVYQVFQPTYASGHYALMMASETVHPYKTPIDWDAIDREGDLPYKYWTPDVHYASFALPNFVAKEVGSSAASYEDIKTPYKWSASKRESARKLYEMKEKGESGSEKVTVIKHDL